MKPYAVAVAAFVLIAGCSTDEQAVTTPQEVVTGWLAALDGSGDPSEFVIGEQLPLLVAVGRAGDGGDIIAQGLSIASAAAYWESFSNGIEAIAGAKPSRLGVGSVTVLAIDGVDHAFVEVGGADGTTVVVVRGTEDGVIDMIATVGPKLVRPLTTVVNTLGVDVIDGPAVAASLRVGLSDPNLDLPPKFYGEVQDLIALIDR